MRDRLQQLVVLALSAAVITGITGCQNQKTITEPQETVVLAETTIPKSALPGEMTEKLTEAPQLHLSDALSSTMNRFSLRSGDYQWNYDDGSGQVSVTACGAHPLEINPDETDKLNVPEYNRMDEVPYSVACESTPDQLVIECWGMDALGDYEREPLSRIDNETTGLIKLKPGQIYVITAVWNESEYSSRGFSGQASYTLLTE